jgi:AraC-like DNA-binding protein
MLTRYTSMRHDSCLHGVMFARFRPEPTRLAMPDVCCDLIWVRKKLFFAGPASRGQPISWPGEEVALLNIDPLTARRWLGFPMAHLLDRRVELRDIDAARAAPLEELFDAGLAAGLVTKPSGQRQMGSRMSVAAEAIRTGMSLDAAAARVELSARQLERLFQDHFGLSPRLYRRILRLRAALQGAANGAGLAAVAAAGGYSDQAHLSREVKSFMGGSPRAVAHHVGKIQDSLAYARDY